jgi:UDP-N-acetylmuramoyl-L-alanyl-D-glutamate--2,6-diaminopimelate ligase
VITYSVAGTDAHLTVAHVKTTMRGTSCTVRITLQEAPREVAVTSPLIGVTNVYNILAAMGAAVAVGVPVETIVKGVAGMRLVKGRFEPVDLGQPFLAVVDYAHTEDALDRLLTTARDVISPPSAGSDKREGRLITVFGCGGDRDKGKRPKMGDVASRLSDMVIVTSDNPRTEDPREIIRDIEAGLRRDNYVVMPDRATAITSAVMLASPGDCVVVAGKGHEEYQEVQGRRHRFSDREALERAITLVWKSSERGAGRAPRASSVTACGDAPLC